MVDEHMKLKEEWIQISEEIVDVKKANPNSPKIKVLQDQQEKNRKSLSDMGKGMQEALKKQRSEFKPLWDLCRQSPFAELSNAAKYRLNEFDSANKHFPESNR